MELQELLGAALHLCHLTRQAPLLLGISGGPDSLCLLDSLARLEFQVVVAHFDHRLRPESGQDAARVRAEAHARGAAFVLGSADVAEYARAERLSLEEAARALRYRFLFQQARSLSAQAVAVGHTADDQVETVLMHLLRGAGLAGLQGMPYRSLLPQWDADIPLVRPLLPFWRSEILAYCQEYGLQPLIDQTNQDISFLRNRLRHELLPLLEGYNPRVRKNLWNMAQALAGDGAIVQQAVLSAWEACLAGQGDGYVSLRRSGFLALSAGLQRGVLRRAIASVQAVDPQRPGSLHDVDFETIQRAIGFVRRDPALGGGEVDLVQGLRLSVEDERLQVSRADLPPDPAWPQIGPQELSLPVPSEVRLPAGWRLLSAWLRPEDVPDFSTARDTAWEAWLDADTLSAGLSLRCSRPGERFQPLGMGGHSLKLSDFWINQKLPRRARPAWPLVVAGDRIVWVPGYRLAHPYRVHPGTHRVLYLRLTKDK